MDDLDWTSQSQEVLHGILADHKSPHGQYLHNLSIRCAGIVSNPHQGISANLLIARSL